MAKITDITKRHVVEERNKIIRALYKKGWSYADIGLMFAVHRSSVLAIIKKVTIKF